MWTTNTLTATAAATVALYTVYRFSGSSDSSSLATLLLIPAVTLMYWSFLRSTSAPQASRAQVVIGTLNVLGNAKNPIEFCPKQFQTSAWKKSNDSFKKALFSVTLRDVIETASDGSKKLLIDWLAQQSKMNSSPNSESDTVCDFLQNEHGVNVRMDNKIEGEHGRYNPIVFGLNSVGDAGFQVFDEETPVFEVASNIPAGNDKIIAAINAFYDEEFTTNIEPSSRVKTGRLSLVSNCDSPTRPRPTLNEALGLLTWDLTCTLAIRRAPEAFLSLCRHSHAIDVESGKPYPQAVLFDRVLDFVVSTSDKYPDAPCIIGLQEPPLDLFKVTSAPPPGFQVHYASHGHPTPAILYSNCQLVQDVSVDPQYNFQDVFVTYLEGAVPIGIRPKIYPTCNRIQVCIFELPSDTRIAMLNIHVSSFKTEVRTLGEFMGFAAAHVQKVLGMPAVIVTDSNVDCVWDKSAQEIHEQIHALEKAPAGILPKELMDAVSMFGDGVRSSNPALKINPPLGTITTMKRRTHFQAQKTKSGRFIVSQKDFLLLPPEVTLLKLYTGITSEVKSNFDLLLPSQIWPADHFGVIGLCEVSSSKTSDS